MLEYPTFFHISSKNPDDADIANRKHYSAPEGALTIIMGKFQVHGYHQGFAKRFRLAIRRDFQAKTCFIDS